MTFLNLKVTKTGKVIAVNMDKVDYMESVFGEEKKTCIGLSDSEIIVDHSLESILELLTNGGLNDY